MFVLKPNNVPSQPDDTASELLIAQSLPEGLNLETQYRQAELIQFENALGDSLGLGVDRKPSLAELAGPIESDYAIALRSSLQEVHRSGDAFVAQNIQMTSNRDAAASAQLVQAFAAEERKIALDAQLARRLQAIDDTGKSDVDSTRYQKAETTLGAGAVERLMANNMNYNGKRKLVVEPRPRRVHVKKEEFQAPAKKDDIRGNQRGLWVKNEDLRAEKDDPWVKKEVFEVKKEAFEVKEEVFGVKEENFQVKKESFKVKKEDFIVKKEDFKVKQEQIDNPAISKGKRKLSFVSDPPKPVKTPTQASYPICGICKEQFHAARDPVLLSKMSSSSSTNRLAYGLKLSCPGRHPYCLNCMTQYLRSKFKAARTGGSMFPVKCPECPIEMWRLGDEEASRILDSDDIVQWHHQKLIESLPKYYCPNPRCSTLMQVDDNSAIPEAPCPACHSLVCIPCHVMWHAGLSCEEYQRLPADERSPEDRLVLKLAKVKNWSRCYNCKSVVELTSGCRHITCTCRAEFCYTCGNKWDKVKKRCSRNPPCELWGEEGPRRSRMGVADRLRAHGAALARMAPRPAVASFNVPIRQPQAQIEPEPWRPVLPPPPPPPPPLPQYQPQPQYRPQPQHRPRPRHQPQPQQHHQSAYGDDEPVYDDEPEYDDNDDTEEPAVCDKEDSRQFDWMDNPQIRAPRHEFTNYMIDTLACGYCNAQLGSLADLQYHLAHVRWHEVIMCCGRLFKRAIDLDRHTEAVDQIGAEHHHCLAKGLGDDEEEEEEEDWYS